MFSLPFVNNNYRREGSIESQEANGGISIKRKKRRIEMVERVERLRQDTKDRSERIFQELSMVHARVADEILPPPVFPFPSSYPDETTQLSELPPSLNPTNILMPTDLYPRPYLFQLHHLSLIRENNLLSNRMFHDHQKFVANNVYNTQVKKIEEEYELATKGVKIRLLESISEKRRKLIEEKANEAINPMVLTDNGIIEVRSHGTRKLRHNSSKPLQQATPPQSNHSSSNRDASTPESDSDPTLTVPSTSSKFKQPKFSTPDYIDDPFELALSLLPSSTSALFSSISGGTPMTSLLSSTAGYGKRKVPKTPSQRTQPGLPPVHFVITSGIPHQLGKSLNGLSGLKSDDVEHDLNMLKRKRGLGRKKTTGDYYED